MAGGSGAGPTFQKLSEELRKAKAAYRKVRGKLDRDIKNLNRALRRESEASTIYVDAKQKLHALEEEINDLTAEEIDLNNDLEKRANTQDDRVMQQRQEKKRRLMEVRQRLSVCLKEKSEYEKAAETSLQEAQRVHNIAERHRSLLYQYVGGAMLEAEDLDGGASEVARDVLPAYVAEDRKYSYVSTKKHKSSSSSAQQKMQGSAEDARKLQAGFTKLAEWYRIIANMASDAAEQNAEVPFETDGIPELEGDGASGGSSAGGGSGASSGRGFHMSERGREVAVGTLMALSMLTSPKLHDMVRPEPAQPVYSMEQQMEEQRQEAMQEAIRPDPIEEEDFVAVVNEKRKRNEWLAPHKKLPR